MKKSIYNSVLPDFFIEKYKEKFGITEKDIEEKNEKYKKFKKFLHDIHGAFEIKKKKKFLKIFEKLKEDPLNKELANEVLKFSYPTRERIPYYEKIYKEIFEEEGEYDILDLACGLNPFSLPYFYEKVKFYLCTEIDSFLYGVLNGYLKILNIGKCVYSDVFEISISDHFDYVFLWKTMPLIERYRKGYTEIILKDLDYEYFVLSFARKTLGLRRYIGRAWIKYVRKICERNNLKIVKEFEIPNEYFFIIKKI